MKRRYDYFNDTYRAAFSLWIGDKAACFKAFNAGIIEPLLDPGEAAGWCQVVKDRRGVILQILIWLPHMNFFTEENGTLVHECFHAAEFCLKHHDVAFGDDQRDADHALAYLMEAIYVAFLRQLHEEYKKKPRKRTGNR